MVITESILLSVKEKLGITAEQTYFDSQLITSINTALLILYQLGIGPSNGFSIRDETAVWSDFLGNDEVMLGMVKEYVPLKVRMLFDPPTGSTVVDAVKSNITELEWRIREMNEIFM